MGTEHRYSRWVWVELTGFDRESPDLGVSAYLDRAGFVPDAVLLLLFNPDFVHTHDGLEEDAPLPFDCCSYAGHPRGYERESQPWTRHELRRLVQELQARGIEVAVSVFDGFVTDEWIGKHSELLTMTRSGNRIRSICPWKRFADGAFYEHYFARKLGEVLSDYGFDGYHLADGYCHPRLTLYEADYSDDMVGQFLGARGIQLPAGFAAQTGDEPDGVRARADWIWRNARIEWIRFHTERISEFCRTVVAAVHDRGRWVVANNALTREPFQAMYRYGVDYQRMVGAGLDGLVLETVAPGVAIGGEGGRPGQKHYDFLAMVLLTSSCVRDIPLRCLNNTHDANEQWDVLEHGPTLLEREVYCNSNLYRWRADGSLQRCSSGPVVCLGDGIEPHQWERLREWWERGFGSTPRRVVGATVVWSDAAHARQLEDYIATRRWSTHKLLYELLAHGAPIHCVADVGAVGAVLGPLVVLNSHLFPEDELAAVLTHARGPVIMIGSGAPSQPPADLRFDDCYGPGQLQCAAYGCPPGWEVSIESDGPEELPASLLDAPEPVPYFEELYFRRVSASFLDACSGLIAALSGAPRVLVRPDVVRAQALELEDGTLRLLVGNDSYHYVVTELDAGREISAVSVVTRFPCAPPMPHGSRVACRVPPRGMVILDLALRQ